jgi:hypothetical protein
MMGHRPKTECPYFVTADKTLIASVPETRARVVLPRILLPQQAVYLADILEGNAATIPGFTRALWSSPRDLPGRIRDYYTDRILKQYEAGLTGEIQNIVESVMERVEGESGGVLRNWKDDEAERIALFKTLDRFETRFYERMSEAKREAGLK